MSEGHVYLVGLMGCGKSAVGPLLAERLSRPFLDADREIERAAGKPIAEIFAADGEAAFRALEAEAVAALARRDGGAVIALGGGAVLDPATRERLRRPGRVIWLTAPPETLAERVEGDPTERPLLSGLAGAAAAARLGALLAARTPCYAEVADREVATAGRPPEEVAREIAAWLASARAVRVELGPRSYDVLIEAGALAHLGRRLRRAGLEAGAAALVVDGGLPRVHVDRALAGLRDGGFEPTVLALPGGEDGKRLTEVGRLVEAFARAKLDRRRPVVALGGGATSDATGFAAAIYLRGVPLAIAPTTLLAQVDASIGGKTAVNLESGKNLAGAFHQPRVVVADVATLGTLPEREVRSGLGEVLKVAMIGPPDLFEWLEARLGRLAGHGAVALAREPEAAVELVARAAALKAGVVSRDERETSGERKVLNFGHTLGHAIEAASGYRVAHGEAVVAGMAAALHLSEAKGLLARAEGRRLLALLDRLGVPPLERAISDDAILEPLLRDKKFAAGRLLFVLLRGQGRPEVDAEVTREEALGALAFLRGPRPLGSGGAP